MPMTTRSVKKAARLAAAKRSARLAAYAAIDAALDNVLHGVAYHAAVDKANAKFRKTIADVVAVSAPAANERTFMCIGPENSGRIRRGVDADKAEITDADKAEIIALGQAVSEYYSPRMVR